MGKARLRKLSFWQNTLGMPAADWKGTCGEPLGEGVDNLVLLVLVLFTQMWSLCESR